MTVNGFELPTSFVRVLRENKMPFWELKRELDAYGNRWETELDLYQDVETIANETAEMPKWFAPESPEEAFEADADAANEPGFIPNIADFSKIVRFGRDGEDNPFCFDFREDSKEPSIIYWDDSYWRRVAPNFESFIGLFKPAHASEADEQP